MDCILKPTLKHISFVKVAVMLWNQADIRILVSKNEKWQEIEDKVLSNVSHLPLPKSLKENVKPLIKPIGLQILNFTEYHHRMDIGLDQLNEFCWTPHGTLDRKKTAEVLVKNEKLPIFVRYILACIYCLVDYILILWNKIPEREKQLFYGDDPMKVCQDYLVILWTYDINGEITKIRNMRFRHSNSQSVNQYAFEYAAKRCNKAATEHFWQNLSPTEREKSLVRATEFAVNNILYDYSDVLDFLFFQVNEQQQMKKMCETNVLAILKHFLGWPRQSYFMKVISHVWDLIDVRIFFVLLQCITTKLMIKHPDYNYQDIFQKVWEQSPNLFKKMAINNWSLLMELFAIKDRESIKLILSYATSSDRMKFFSNEGHKICINLICEDEWDFLKFFIEEFISPKDKIVNFRNEFEGYLRCHCLENNLEFPEIKMDKFSNLLDDIIIGFNDRNCLEAGSNQPKILKI